MSAALRVARPVCQSCERRPATEVVRFGQVRFRVCSDCYPTGQAVAS